MKTVPTGSSVSEFLDAIPDARRRADARTVHDLLTSITGEDAVMWGPSIVGFGRQHLTYASGRELDSMVVGFAPRKTATTLYFSDGFDSYADHLGRLGPHTIGKSCLHIKRLSDIDRTVLAELVQASVNHVRAAH